MNEDEQLVGQAEPSYDLLAEEWDKKQVALLYHKLTDRIIEHEREIQFLKAVRGALR